MWWRFDISFNTHNHTHPIACTQWPTIEYFTRPWRLNILLLLSFLVTVTGDKSWTDSNSPVLSYWCHLSCRCRTALHYTTLHCSHLPFPAIMHRKISCCRHTMPCYFMLCRYVVSLVERPYRRTDVQMGFEGLDNLVWLFCLLIVMIDCIICHVRSMFLFKYSLFYCFVVI